MIYLVDGLTNKVRLRVNAAIDISGFSAALSICGKTVYFDNLGDKNLQVEFSAEEVSLIDSNGTYGALVIYDAKTNPYIIVSPYFKKISQDYRDEISQHQTIWLTVASTFEGQMAESGSSEPGDWATKGEVCQVESRCIEYTNEKIKDVAIEAIDKTDITVQNPDGESVSMTIQGAVQEVVNMQNSVNKIANTKLSGHVVDEEPADGQPDDETLYLTSNMVLP